VASPGETKTHFPYLKQENDFLEPACFPIRIIDGTDICVSLKHLFDVSTFLLQNAFEMTTPLCHHSLMSYACKIFCRSTTYQLCNNHGVCCCWSRPCNGFCLRSFDNCCHWFYSVTSLNWNSRSNRRKRILGCWLLPGGATSCYKFDEQRTNGCVENKTVLKCARNHTNWFMYFEDVGNRALFFGPPRTKIRRTWYTKLTKILIANNDQQKMVIEGQDVPHNAVLACYMLWAFVHPSVTSQYCSKRAKQTIM